MENKSSQSAAILAPGPSIKRFDGRKFDLVIGVNRAGLYVKCDLISVYNKFNYDICFPKNYNPLILTKKAQYEQKVFYRPHAFYRDTNKLIYNYNEEKEKAKELRAYLNKE